MIKPIVTHDIHKKDNPKVLQEKTRRITDFECEETRNCVKDLNDTLDQLIKDEGNKRGAIGLSANQIAYPLAMSAVTLGDTRYMFINPEIIEKRGHDRLFRIGCFSLYEYRAMVRYNDDVTIAYYDPDGNRQTIDLKGDRSCVVQHEMDHLDGLLLFERLEHKEKDLFVPREALYKDGKVPLRNHGKIFELRRKLGLNKTISAPIWYSSLFNDYSDYVSLVEKTSKEYRTMLKLIEQYTPVNGKILEAGNGIGALSVYLDKKGYEVRCCIEDDDMRELAQRINDQNDSSVSYVSGNMTSLPFEDKAFNTIFSYEVLETLDDAALEVALLEGLRTAETYIFMVPTIKLNANTLKGNERLRTREAWEEFLNKNQFEIVESNEICDGGYVIFAIK
ncbi:MAG: peptide deformylase [Erysipelotrichaceae bacterium]|nr:peptide deformylase [Erysipelotrichaceae bacterium]